LCFNNAPGNKKEFNFTKKDEKENDDFSLLLGDNKKADLATEMGRIAAQELRKVPNGKSVTARGKGGHSQAMPNRTSTGNAGFFVPFDQKLRNKNKDVVVNHMKSASFSATSREAWQTSHASKTNAPEVGKYKPKFNQVEKIGIQHHIIAPRKNIGQERILDREI